MLKDVEGAFFSGPSRLRIDSPTIPSFLRCPMVTGPLSRLFFRSSWSSSSDNARCAGLRHSEPQPVDSKGRKPAEEQFQEMEVPPTARIRTLSPTARGPPATQKQAASIFFRMGILDNLSLKDSSTRCGIGIMSNGLKG